MKRIISRITSVFMLVYCLLGGSVFPAETVTAEELQPVVKIIVPDTLNVDKNYNIQISIENVKDLYGYSLNFIYDPQVLKVEELKGGNIFDSQGTLAKELSNSVSNDTGAAAYSRTLTTAVPGVEGSGTLVNLQVKPLSVGNIPFNVTQSPAEKLALLANTLKLQLTDTQGQAITYTSTNIVKTTEIDDIPASVIGITPADKAEEVSSMPDITVTYDEIIAQGDKFHDITLLDINNKPVAVNAYIENNVLKLTPRGELENFLTYRLLIPGGAIKDEVGNVTTSDYSTTFTVDKAAEDINKDGYINIFDIAPVARNYDVQESDPAWVARYDIRTDGIINMMDLIAIAKKFVIEQAITISDIPDTNVTIFRGSSYTLPKDVQVVMSDGSTKNVQVTWNPGTIDTTKSGKYLFEGTVKQYVSKARLFVTIIESNSGNTGGNLVNRGYFQEQAGKIYYVDINDSGKLYSRNSDGSGPVKLSDEDFDVHHINVVGEWIYYASYYGLYKIKIDGSERTVLENNWINNVSVVDNWIYFLSNGNLYRKSVSGGDSQYLAGWGIGEFNVSGNSIYYRDYNLNLSKINLDGSNQTNLPVGGSMWINVIGDWVYYVDRNSNYAIYRIKTDGTENQLISAESAYCLNITGDNIYYRNGLDNYAIYTMKLDGTGRKKLADTDSYDDFINVTGNWIYFNIYDNSVETMDAYRMRLDGSSIQRVVSIANIEPINKVINQYDYFEFPYILTVTLDNGATENVGVSWNSGGLDTNEPGTYTFEGTVNGYDKKVILTVTVEAVDLSEIINFEDITIENAVRSQIGNWDREIIKSQVTNITSLYLGNTEITSLSGLENLVNLQELWLQSTGISDISTLSSLKNLQYLYLSCNNITDINPLSNLTNLIYLELGGNQIQDVSMLSGLNRLQYLYLGQNQISDISALAGLFNLYELQLKYNQIVDVTPLSGLSNLRYLLLSENPITDYSPLAGIYYNLWGFDFNLNEPS